MLRLPNDWVWDSWAADDGDQYHLFFLKAPRSLKDPNLRYTAARIGHATSTDLLDWTVQSDALLPAANGWDDLALWTGSVLRGDDGVWRLYYSALSTTPGHGERDQRIGMAESDDLCQHLPCERARRSCLTGSGRRSRLPPSRRSLRRGPRGWRGSSRTSAPSSRAPRWRTSMRLAGGSKAGLGGSTPLRPTGLSLLSARRKRGLDAMIDAGVLPAFRGVAVHEGWAPHRNFTEATHALCGAHHLRELTAVHEQGQAWALGMSCLLLDTKDAVEQAKAAGRKRLSAKPLAELPASRARGDRDRLRGEPRPGRQRRSEAQADQGAEPAAAPRRTRG